MSQIPPGIPSGYNPFRSSGLPPTGNRCFHPFFPPATSVSRSLPDTKLKGSPNYNTSKNVSAVSIKQAISGQNLDASELQGNGNGFDINLEKVEDDNKRPFEKEFEKASLGIHNKNITHCKNRSYCFFVNSYKGNLPEDFPVQIEHLYNSIGDFLGIPSREKNLLAINKELRNDNCRSSNLTKKWISRYYSSLKRIGDLQAQIRRNESSLKRIGDLQAQIEELKKRIPNSEETSS